MAVKKAKWQLNQSDDSCFTVNNNDNNNDKK